MRRQDPHLQRVLGHDDDSNSAITLSRAKRESFFNESLLKKLHPEFFDEHFMKHPVVFISFDSCKRRSSGGMVKRLCNAIARSAQHHLDELKHSKKPVRSDALDAEKSLRTYLEKAEQIGTMSDNDAAQFSEQPSFLFGALSRFVRQQFGGYILLVDEYDIPFLTLLEGTWDEVDRDDSSTMLETLFQDMFKGNSDKLKGLMTGVFEMSLLKVGSGPNNIKDIFLIPTSTTDITSSLQASQVRHSRGGIDALSDAFLFNATEVRLMLVKCTEEQYTQLAEYYDVTMATIREFYNGYYIGRFCGKYNPWSVCSYLEKLCENLRLQAELNQESVTSAIKSSAERFWVRTGSTKLITNQFKKHYTEATCLLQMLIGEYEEHRYLPVEEQLAPSDTPRASIKLGNAKLVASYFEGDQFSDAAFLSICLQAGYLTRRTARTVCIPNEELVLAWRNMLAELVLGVKLSDTTRELEKGKLLMELWRNNPKPLGDLIVQSHSALVGHMNFREKDFANHAANSVKAAAMFGALSHPRAKLGMLTDTLIHHELAAGDGRCNMALHLASTTNRAKQFGVIIEFKLIESTRCNDMAHCLERARAGLRQIEEKNYRNCISDCLERMDIGLAIGSGAATADSKVYRRANVNSPWLQVESLLPTRAG
ncbi:hypothetical protein H4S07_000452 [Coemansia furcata]|uniref:Uncharacterized protein n=1 Tax=Coemansia furcata TaxID=417177 RepID=A0ACC1LRP0_9FUNG|nr:hypothetical protein H4S07_000452 [Coemansia furcata]